MAYVPSNRTGLLRNLEQIEEDEPERRGVRPGTLLLTSLGGACVVFALVSQGRRKPAVLPQAPDPLGALVAQGVGARPASLELAGKDVTFPSMLSDAPRATTALAAVRAAPPSTAAALANTAPASGGAALAVGTASSEHPTAPPPATDRLTTTTALPARSLLDASHALARPHDVLAQMAKQAAVPTGPAAEEGKPGGYQLQASSFRDDVEAQQFATMLRQRGHRAHVETAHIPGRGTWYRVRVGPFKSQREALVYRSEFEKRERLAPFLVEPPKEKSGSRTP